MTKAIWLAGAAVCAMAEGPAMAQSVPIPTGPVTAGPDADAARHDGLVFEPAFFASARPDTALDMVVRLPGFSLDGGDRGNRGLAGTAGNVLIDGARPSTKSDRLDQILDRISAGAVARIELIRGGAPGIDMQGQAVVANVILVRTVTVERVIEADTDILTDGRVAPRISARYSRRDGDDQIEGTLSGYQGRTEGDRQGFRRRYSPAGILTEDADLRISDEREGVQATGVVQRRLSDGLLRINGLAGVSAYESSQDTLIRSGPGVDRFNDEREDEVEGELGLSWTRNLGPRTGLELTGLQRYDNEDYIGVSESSGGSSTFNADTTTGESIGRAILRFRPNERWAIETGGEIAYNFLDGASAYSENGVPVPLPSSSVKVEELRGEVFGQITWRPGPTLTLEGGLRIETSEIHQSGDSDLRKSFVYPKPRLLATWTPWAGHQFRLRLEREVGQLDFNDFTASADIDIGQVEGGNPNLEPQKSTLVEAVHEFRFWDEGVFETTWQYAEIEDVVDIIPLAGGFDGVGNIGDGTSESIQLSLTLPTGRLGVPDGRLRLRGRWSSTSVLDPLTGEARRFQYNQGFGCGINFDQDLLDGRLTWGVEHGCDINKGQLFRVREVRTFYGEPGMEAYVEWKPRSDLTVRVELSNITDRVSGNDRELYAGPRNAAPLASRETRRIESAPWLAVAIRRSF